jgi:hypothetical protein
MQVNSLNSAEIFKVSKNPGNYISNPNQKEGTLVYYINETELKNCPHTEVQFGTWKLNALAASGSQISLMSDKDYQDLTASGCKSLELPINSAVLITAFGNHSRHLRKQILFDFSIKKDKYKQICLISSQLIPPIILGADFLFDYGI